MTSSRSILIIDNDSNSQQLYVAALTGIPLSFHSCYNGLDGYNEITSDSYDVVILNYPIAGVELEDFFAQLNRGRIKYPPIIVIANDSSTELQQTFMENGADYFLIKPFNMSFLKYVVKEALAIEDVTDIPLQTLLDESLKLEKSSVIWVKTPQGQGMINIEQNRLSRICYDGYTAKKALSVLNEIEPIKIERVLKEI